jgi:hypothetical protein
MCYVLRGSELLPNFSADDAGGAAPRFIERLSVQMGATLATSIRYTFADGTEEELLKPGADVRDNMQAQVRIEPNTCFDLYLSPYLSHPSLRFCFCSGSRKY